MTTPESASAPSVDYVRPEVVTESNKWQKVKDCLEGEQAVKDAGDKYLPRPNPEDTSVENQKRYESYKTRAVFYNATRRTLDGLVGQVFMRDPVVSLPAKLEVLLTDVDGAGVSLEQQSKKCLSHSLGYGRSGLLADYPTVDGATTEADATAGYIRPTITLYEPWDVINWRTVTIGARKLLSLVVLRESYVEEDDGFEMSLRPQWRVLRLRDKTYMVEIWKEDSEVPEEVIIPLDSNGKPLSEIPFIFVGVTNNDPEVDPAPLHDLATLNIAHYRNSADYEESSFLVGQPTPFFAGLTKNWVDEVLKGKVMLGSRSAIPLPEGGFAGLLQANPNTMPKDAMDTKERQMVALGAKLVEQREVQRTLGEAQLENSAETSILATAARNVSAAYRTALKWCSVFSGDETEIKFDLNTDFPAARMTPEERAQLVAEWQAGAIDFEELRNQLRKAGVATKEDEEVRTANEEDQMRVEQKKLAIEEKAATMGNNPGNSKTGGTSNGRVAPKQNGKTQ